MFSAETIKSIRYRFSTCFPKVHYACNFYCDAYEEEPTLYITDNRSGMEYTVTTMRPNNTILDKKTMQLVLMERAMVQKASNCLTPTCEYA